MVRVDWTSSEKNVKDGSNIYNFFYLKVATLKGLIIRMDNLSLEYWHLRNSLAQFRLV